MDQVVPWEALRALVFAVYPKAGDGRPPIEDRKSTRLNSSHT